MLGYLLKLLVGEFCFCRKYFSQNSQDNLISAYVAPISAFNMVLQLCNTPLPKNLHPHIRKMKLFPDPCCTSHYTARSQQIPSVNILGL